MTRDEKWLLEEKYGGDASAPGFAEDCHRLAQGEPVAYVISWQPFLDLKINLDSRPLIPRPETEWWTEQLLNELARPDVRQVGNDDLRVFRRATARGAAIFQQKNTRPANHIGDLCFLDLCAGSGAIGCAALAHLPNATVYFGEADPIHEQTILKNIRENALDESRADIRIGDLFEPFGPLRFDVVAANPPYIPETRALPESVTRHEPPLALYAGADGLGVIRRIAASLADHLNPGGVAWIECDAAHADAARALFEAAGALASIRTDQYAVPRLIVVSFP